MGAAGAEERMGRRGQRSLGVGDQERERKHRAHNSFMPTFLDFQNLLKLEKQQTFLKSDEN